MLIKQIKIKAEGYVQCHSDFYSALDIIADREYVFTAGINGLSGEIDSGAWAISYLMSMFYAKPADFILESEINVQINDVKASMDAITEHSCYMDVLYPLFASNASVRDLVNSGLMKTGIDCSAEDVKELFHLDDQRFERPLDCCGNEKIRAMAAIGHSYGKQIYCFPWLSKKRFDGYHNNLTWLLDELASMNMTVILPVGQY